MFDFLLTPKIKPYIDWFFIIFKAIWRTTTTVVMLIAYSFLLYVLITYYRLDTSSLQTFFLLIDLLVKNWAMFWMAIFFSHLWDKYKWSKRMALR